MFSVAGKRAYGRKRLLVRNIPVNPQMNPDLFSSLAIQSNQSDFTSKELKDEALERVEEHASPEWKRKVFDKIVDVCTKKREFTADDVQVEGTHNNSALGAMIKKAERLGICRPVGYTRSTRKGRHAGVLILWKSCLS